MVGFILGAIGGAIELYLLGLLVRALNDGQAARTALLVFIKIIVLAAAFAPVVLLMRTELLWCGVGFSISLVAGAFIRFLLQIDKAKKNREGAK